jgi:hypothetical protein
MAELFASPESGAVVEKLPSGRPVATARHSPATAPDEAPVVKTGRKRKRMANEQTKEAQDVAATRVPLDENLNGSGLEDDGILQQMDEITSAAAKAAKDYRSWMLEHMKVNINAALDYANGIASASLPPDFAGPAAGQPHEQEKNSGTPKLERQLPTPAKAAEEYRAKAFELMTANVNATLEYAQRLANVKSPAEFIELSTSHARKHCELIMTHTAALRALSLSSMTTNAEQMTASIAKVFSRQRA